MMVMPDVKSSGRGPAGRGGPCTVTDPFSQFSSVDTHGPPTVCAVAKLSIARSAPAEQTPSASQTRQLKKPDLRFVFIAPESLNRIRTANRLYVSVKIFRLKGGPTLSAL